MPARKSDRELLEAIHRDVVVVVEKTASHERTLYGNGQKGLCREVHELTAWHRQWFAMAALVIALASAAAALRAAW